MRPTVESACAELLWIVQTHEPSFQAVLRRIELFNSLASDSPVEIVSDDVSMRLGVRIGTTKAWHILRTPIELEGWKRPAFCFDTDAIQRAWKDLEFAIRPYASAQTTNPSNDGAASMATEFDYAEIVRNFFTIEGEKHERTWWVTQFRKLGIKPSQSSPMRFRRSDIERTGMKFKQQKSTG